VHSSDNKSDFRTGPFYKALQLRLVFTENDMVFHVNHLGWPR